MPEPLVLTDQEPSTPPAEPAPRFDESSDALPLRRPSAEEATTELSLAPVDDAPGDESEGRIPERYELRELEGHLVLRSKEAPGLAVRIDRGFAFAEAEAKKLGERVVLLDGAGQFGPTVDDGRHLYNLDHHAGCVRAFTLATCEQALVLVLKGLDLEKGDWTIYANEPDLDTLLAIWVLLNYRRVRALDVAGRDALLPLLRLEGAIDANGLEVAEHCGLPQALVATEHERLKRLHRRELELKRRGDWQELDPAEYTRRMLLEVDAMVFTDEAFQDFASVEKEYGHVDIGQDRVAVVCRDSAGIYEVERRLKKNWGERLGLIALETRPGHFTLRRVASLAGIDLATAYDRLNLLDPAVDGRPREKRWGGSDDIGGSPRPDGTGLLPREIAKILRLAYRRPGPWARTRRLLGALLWPLGVAALGAVAALTWFPAARGGALAAGARLAVFGLVAGTLSLLLTRSLSRGWTWIFGWRRPAGRTWWLFGLLTLPGVVLGGAWLPTAMTDGSIETDSVRTVGLALTGGTLLAGLGLALTFFGLGHGIQTMGARSSPARRWWPTLSVHLAAVGYGLTTTGAVFFGLTPYPESGLGGWMALGGVLAGGFLVGEGAGLARDRSLSVWSAAVLLVVGSALRWLLLV